jgi:adenine-specific DNA-methyltransferase
MKIMSEINYETIKKRLACFPNPIRVWAKRADPQADTSALEGEIDQLVYQLYGLSEDEVRIVEGRE